MAHFEAVCELGSGSFANKQSPTRAYVASEHARDVLQIYIG